LKFIYIKNFIGFLLHPLNEVSSHVSCGWTNGNGKLL